MITRNIGERFVRFWSNLSNSEDEGSTSGWNATSAHILGGDFWPVNRDMSKSELTATISGVPQVNGTERRIHDGISSMKVDQVE
jgi:hypothetical protein